MALGATSNQKDKNHRLPDKELVTQNYRKICIRNCYLSLGCWKRCGLHFEDSYNEQFFLDESYFRSKTYITFSTFFALLQISACLFFVCEIISRDDSKSDIVLRDDGKSAVWDNLAVMIGSGIDGLLLLAINIVQLSCMCKGKRKAECAQLWHIARMAIGPTAALAFYLGGFFTALLDLYVYNFNIKVDKSIGNVSHRCPKLADLDPYGNSWNTSSYGITWSTSAVNDWICVFFAEEWQFIDFIYVSTGPQTVFLHALPARLTLPILIIEIVASFLLFFWSTWKTGTSFFPIYLWFYQMCFALGLALVTLTAERESRRNFKGRANWRYLQNMFRYRLRMSKRLKQVMKQDCPKELKWIQEVGDRPGLVPLHTENIHLRLGVPAEEILNSGNLRRAMHGEDLTYLRIPAEEIEEFDVKLGHGGQANVFKGRWKPWGRSSIDVAIKKWGSRKTTTHVDELSKYTNEVNVLIRLTKSKYR